MNELFPYCHPLQIFIMKNDHVEIVEYSRSNNLEGVNECLDRGDDVNAKENYHKSTSLIISCCLGHPDIVSRLVKKAGKDINYDYQDQWGSTAAHEAVTWGHTDCVRILAVAGRGIINWNKKNNCTHGHRREEKNNP